MKKPSGGLNFAMAFDEYEPINNLGLTKNLDQMMQAQKTNPEKFNTTNEENESFRANMEVKSVLQYHKAAHNADELIASADHSDIKNTQKVLFNSSNGASNLGFNTSGSVVTDSTADLNNSSVRPSISGGAVNPSVALHTPNNNFKAS